MLGLKKKRIIWPKWGQHLTMRHSGITVLMAHKSRVSAYQRKTFRVLRPRYGFYKVTPNQILEMRPDFEEKKE